MPKRRKLDPIRVPEEEVSLKQQALTNTVMDRFFARPAGKLSEAEAAPKPISAQIEDQKISPAIIAGRLRHERKNYKLFSHLVGQGEVHRQLLS